MLTIRDPSSFRLTDNGVQQCQVVTILLPRFIAQLDVEYYRDDIEVILPESIKSKLRKGAVIAVNHVLDRNDHIYGFWTGEEIIKIDLDTVTDYGFIPASPMFDVISMDVPIRFWYDSGILGYFENCVWIDESKMTIQGDQGQFTCGGITYSIPMNSLVGDTHLKLLEIENAIHLKTMN